MKSTRLDMSPDRLSPRRPTRSVGKPSHRAALLAEVCEFRAGISAALMDGASRVPVEAHYGQVWPALFTLDGHLAFEGSRGQHKRIDAERIELLRGNDRHARHRGTWGRLAGQDRDDGRALQPVPDGQKTLCVRAGTVDSDTPCAAITQPGDGARQDVLQDHFDRGCAVSPFEMLRANGHCRMCFCEAHSPFGSALSTEFG